MRDERFNLRYQRSDVAGSLVDEVFVVTFLPEFEQIVEERPFVFGDELGPDEM